MDALQGSAQFSLVFFVILLPITLAPGDIADCFRYALWDEDKQRMVSYREAGRRA